jgi:heme exporter protein A
MSEPPAIEVGRLYKSFGDLYALRDISLSVNKGEFVTIFGPNGAGKTTLIRILSTITTATSGKLTIGGFSLGKQSHEIRKRIGLIAHQTLLYDNLSAEENLLFYAKLYGLKNATEVIHRSLDEVGLLPRKDDHVRTFSRGMQQRLSIARAMLHNPEILFLDEPYTGLDKHAAEMLSGWLRRLKNSRNTILMVTHNLEAGLEMADRVAVLLKGRLVYDKYRSEIQSTSFKAQYDELVYGGTAANAAAN